MGSFSGTHAIRTRRRHSQRRREIVREIVDTHSAFPKRRWVSKIARAGSGYPELLWVVGVQGCVRGWLQRPADDREYLDAVAGPSLLGRVTITEASYIQLVDWTGRQLHPGKRGVIDGDTPPALQVTAEPAQWIRQVRGIESRYCRAIGSAEALIEKAKAMGQRWLMVRRRERVLV